MNVDDAPVVASTPLPTPNDRAALQGAAEWLSAPHLFVGRNPAGLVVCVVVPVKSAVHEARRIGKTLLSRCGMLHEASLVLPSLSAAHAKIVLGDATGVAVWRLRRGSTEHLTATNGLLTLSAGHSSDTPLPGGGWLIGRLDHLHRRRSISPTDVEQALCEVRLGDSTACTVIIEPASGRALVVGAADDRGRDRVPA